MADLKMVHGEKCRICDGYICKGKAMYYKEPLKNLCNKCRKIELDKYMNEEEGEE